MSDPRDRVDRFLHDGERVTETVDAGDGRLVMTTHRLLVFTPEGDGANFRAVDRPNVEEVRVRTGGNGRYLRWTVRPLLLGGILLLAGTRLEIGDPLSGVDTSGAGRTGAGGVLSTVSDLTSLLTLLDDLMVTVGAMCLLVVAALLGLYLYSRETSLVVSVAGGDDVALPTDGGGKATVTRLEAALASAGAEDGTGGDAPSDGPAPESSPDSSSNDEPLGVEDVLPAGDGDGPPEPPERSNAGDEGK